MKIFYDIPYIQGIMKYVLIPVAAVIIIVGVSLFIYSTIHKDHEDPRYNFVMNFWSSLIGIILTGAILAMAVGFSVAMTEKMQEYGLVEEKKMLYYLLKYFIIIPFIFVIWYIVKFLKTIYYKPRKSTTNKKDDTKTNENISPNNNTGVEANAQLNYTESSIDKKEENTLAASSVTVAPPLKENLPTPAVEEAPLLPPMEQTIEEEMKQFKQEESSSIKEEPEIISLEDE